MAQVQWRAGARPRSGAEQRAARPRPVLGLEALEVLVVLIEGVERATALAAVGTGGTVFHSSICVEPISGSDSERLAMQRRDRCHKCGTIWRRSQLLVPSTVSHFWHSASSEILAAASSLELEARVGIEPTHKAFAEPCLTTWLPRRLLVCRKLNQFGSQASAKWGRLRLGRNGGWFPPVQTAHSDHPG